LAALVEEHVVPYSRTYIDPSLFWNRFLVRYRRFRRAYRAMVAHCATCASEINNGGFDLLFSASCLDFAVSPIARFATIPSILYLQEPKRSLYEANPMLPWVAPPEGTYRLSRFKAIARDLDQLVHCRVRAREERNDAAAFDTILVNSAFSRETILRVYGLEGHVCYLGIDTDLFQTTNEPKEPFVVGLGSLQSHKGLDTAVRAVAAIPRSGRPTLVWVGNLTDADHLETIAKLAEDNGVVLESRSMVSDADLVSLLSRATAMLYTSRLEPFGFAPLEAAACGTPVVAVAEGGVRETIRHDVNGLLVDDRDPKAIACALMKLLDNPGYARQLGQNAAEHARQCWTWDAAISRLESSFVDLLRAHNGPLTTGEDSPSDGPRRPPVAISSKQ
jgi:glycosyltransferase involved in cell wall biosynthesis